MVSKFKMIKYGLGIISMIIIYSCDIPSSRGGDFYSYSKDGDLYRIPLLEPFEVYNSGSINYSWSFDLPYKNSGLVMDQIGVDEVGVQIQDSILVLYSYRMSLPGKMSQAWFIVNLKEKKELYFTDSSKYYEHISNIGGIELFRCEEIFKEFEETKKLPW